MNLQNIFFEDVSENQHEFENNSEKRSIFENKNNYF